jgi:hypothetical protein
LRAASKRLQRLPLRLALVRAYLARALFLVLEITFFGPKMRANYAKTRGCDNRETPSITRYIGAQAGSPIAATILPQITKFLLY